MPHIMLISASVYIFSSVRFFKLFVPKSTSNSFIRSKCYLISVDRILLMKHFLISCIFSNFRFIKILHSFFRIIFNVVAIWCCSSTDLSWYLMASLDMLFISKTFVFAVWATSWHNPENNKANSFVSFISREGLLVRDLSPSQQSYSIVWRRIPFISLILWNETNPLPN